MTPSPASRTTPVVLPVAYLKSERINESSMRDHSLHHTAYKNNNDTNTYKLRTACIDMNSAGTLKVSKKISAAFSLFRLGFKGASVSNTGCYNSKLYVFNLANTD